MVSVFTDDHYFPPLFFFLDASACSFEVLWQDFAIYRWLDPAH
jgi:indole-3-glycerol phosphate synthase